MNTHKRYAIRTIRGEYVGHRSYNGVSYQPLGDFERARLWVRKSDALKAMDSPNDLIVEVTVVEPLSS